jgi:hypothetical protein
MPSAKTIDDYIAALGDTRGAIVAELVSIVDGAAPEAVGSVKWAQPVWESNGPFAYAKAFSKGVNFGFWRGVDLDDPGGLLVGDGLRMRHVRLASPADAVALRETLAGWVRRAVELNGELGDPTGR